MAFAWDDLHAFLCVRRAGSFLHAARELQVEHTTVARRVTRLEEALGTTLFHRGRRGVRPTVAGHALAHSLERVENEVHAAARLATEQDAAVSGTVRLATSEIFAAGFLCGQLGGLATRYPSLRVEVLTAQTSVDLSLGEADLAVRLLPVGRAPAQADVKARKLGGFGFALYASRAYLAAHPLDAELSLSGHTLVGYVEVSRAPGRAWLQERGAGAVSGLQVNSVPVATAAAVAGLGLAVLPAFYAAREPELVCVSEVVEESVLWLLVRPEMKRSRRVAAVHAWLTEVVGAHFGRAPLRPTAR